MRKIISVTALVVLAPANTLVRQSAPLAIGSQPLRRIALPSGTTSVAEVQPTDQGGVVVIAGGVALTYRGDETAPAQSPLRRASEGSGPRNVVMCTQGQLATFDPSHGQLRLFQKDGSFLSATPWPESLGGRVFALVGCQAGVVLGLKVQAAAPGARTLVENHVVVVAATVGGTLVGTLDTLPDSRIFRGLIQPFSAHATGAANQRTMVWGTGDTNVVYARSAGSARTCAWRMPGLLRTRVTPALRDEWLVAFKARTPKTIYSELGPILDSLPWPAATPYWDKLILDDADRLWVRAFDPAPTSLNTIETWWVYESPSAKGRRLMLPPGFGLRAVSNGDAWITHLDGGETRVDSYSISNLRDGNGRAARPDSCQ